MRLLFLFFFTSILYFNNILAESDSDFEYGDGQIDQIINETINKFVQNISDPLTISNFYESFNDAILTGPFNISDGKLTGVHTIAASYINAQINIFGGPSLINITIGLENINLFLNYDTTLIVAQLLPVYGKGNLSVNLDQISIDLYAKVSLLPLDFQDVLVELSIGKDTSISIEGFMHSDDFSKLLNDVIAELGARIIDFLNVNKDRVGQLIGEILKNLLNGINKSYSFMNPLYIIFQSIKDSVVIPN